jgi:hypothetical protein
VQWTTRADRPKPSVWTGRGAARYKNLVTSLVMHVPRVERRLPGAVRWPRPERAAALEPVAA